MSSNSQQSGPRSIKVQTIDALSAVPASAWAEYEKATGRKENEFRSTFRLPTRGELRTIQAKQNRDWANDTVPSLYMFEVSHIHF
jgi:hypothetical protein